MNKRFLITGASSGLGLALTRQLLKAGASVAAVARDAQRLHTALPSQPRLLKIAADIASKEDTYRIQADAAASMGEVDVLIHNASYLGSTPLRQLMDSDCEDLEQTLQTNVVGPFRLTKAVAAGMLLRKHGIVVHISSDAALSAYPEWGAYSASKAAHDHMIRIFAAELGERGLSFISIDPGEMATPMHAAALPDADVNALKSPELSALQVINLLNNNPINGNRYVLPAQEGVL